ncbi:MAG: adenylate/guanylate cyclase domain-containing protein [Leptospiraceae bacterium]|nr:adenylate/guanylate cyclase domain-containing protein [Leptospiraceae bacterium]
MQDFTKLDSFQKVLDEEVNSSLEKLSYYSMILGLSSSVILTLVYYFNIMDKIEIPIIWTLFGGIFSLIFYLLAKKKLTKGRFTYLIIISYSSFPSLILVFAHFLLPSGSISYITGPPSYLYFFMIVLSGFAYNPRLSIFIGLITGIQYFIFYFIDRHNFQKLSSSDSIILQDIVSTPLYFFKSVMMLFTGIGVAVFTKSVIKFISKVLQEEEEKKGISKLFGQFVSDEVKDKILADKKGLVGEKKVVTILFSDIRDFTTISEKLPPEVLVRMLNDYFDRMVLCISRNGGIVDKFIGDAIMAVFGGLIEQENSCESAFQAAIEMQIELDNFNKTLAHQGIENIQFGIGLHFGEVIQGAIGGRDRKEFTVVGDAVNLASRVESLTKEKERYLLVTEKFYENLAPNSRTRFEYLGETKVKGKTEVIKIYGIKS